jgi:hypothetical protein
MKKRNGMSDYSVEKSRKNGMNCLSPQHIPGWKSSKWHKEAREVDQRVERKGSEDGIRLVGPVQLVQLLLLLRHRCRRRWYPGPHGLKHVAVEAMIAIGGSL